MKFGLVLLISVVLLAIIAKLAKANRKQALPSDARYTETGHLLTPAEISFFAVLKTVIEPTQMIFAKVRQADILKPSLAKHHPQFWTLFNRIAQRHVDFVICEAQTTKPLIIIELNDSTHRQDHRKKRDDELRVATKFTSIRLIEIQCAKNYAPNELRQLIYGNGYHENEAQTPDLPTKTPQHGNAQFSPRQSTDKSSDDCKDTCEQPKKVAPNLIPPFDHGQSRYKN